MTLSVFPDVNVWIAIASAGHKHHLVATTWVDSLDEREPLIFCRFTQLGMLRLLTLSGVMGSQVKTQREAWAIYDELLWDGNARLMSEPHSVGDHFRRFANLNSASPKDWGDSYLAAFSSAASLTLVTFDTALAGRVKDAILLVGT